MRKTPQHREPRKRRKEQRQCEEMRCHLEELVLAAERVCVNHGTHEDGTPSDYNDWTALRVAISEIRTKYDIHGVSPWVSGPMDYEQEQR